MTDYSKLTNRDIDVMISERVMGEIRPDPKWQYSTDDNAVRLVRSRIEELGIVQMYLGQLTTIFQSLPSRDLDYRWHWLQATPRQQCEAALRSLEAK